MEAIQWPDGEELAAAARRLEAAEPQEVLRWGVERFGRGLVLACSFQAEDLVLLDMLVTLIERPRVLYVDTGLLFPETYALRDQVAARYPVELIPCRPDLSVAEQEEHYGPRLWERDPDLCCHLRKVVPLGRGLRDAAAWVTGMRREQAPTRARLPVVQWDARFGRVKLNPLARWTWAQVWTYVVERDLPRHPLYARGYASIGCWPCTTPVAPGEHPRAGRWRGRGKTECGLHAAGGGEGA